jgi:hypothetical protein
VVQPGQDGRGDDSVAVTDVMPRWLRKLLGRHLGNPSQGVLGLTRTHPRERVLHAATVALTHSRFRYKELARLAAGDGAAEAPRPLIADDPAIRPLTEYTLELFR